MRRVAPTVALTVLLTQGALSADSTFYVSPQGNDKWSGRFDAPNKTGTDGPFATLTRARDAVREARAADAETSCTVLVRGGLYCLREPLQFGPQDSGAEGTPVTYAAYPGERPVVSGGRLITGWEQGPDKLWTVALPEVKAGEWYFRQLFVNGERRTRARQPNEGYLLTAGPLPEFPSPNRERGNAAACMGFQYKPGDIKPWADLEDVNLFLYHSWTASLHWIADLDEAARTVRFTAPSGWPVCYWEREQRYHLEGFREALDQPGEWYLDRKAGVLYYWPLPGEDLAKAQIVAPALAHIVELQGDPTLGLPVEHLTFRGLSFQHADWVLDRNQPADGQAAIFLTGALFARGARHCTLEECEVAHVGGYGIWFEQGCQDDLISQCEVHDLGGGGIKVGEAVSRDDDRILTQRITVDNCFIHDGGHVFPAGVGVWIGRNSYNRITHNEICDFFYTGVSVGWSWGYAPTSAHDNLVEWNHIHHIGMGVLSDMGGIYTLGQSPGTRLAHNLIHDIYHYKFGAAAIYPDEGSSDILIENNLCYDTSTGGFSQHYGRDNLVRNNIFAFGANGDVRVARVEEHHSVDFYRNIVYSDDGILVGANWVRAKLKSDYNCWWDTLLREEADFDGWNLMERREQGYDEHSIVADPGFVAPERRDFRLKPDSPALQVGFKPFDLSGTGLYGNPAWVAKPRQVKRPPVKLPPPPSPSPPLTSFSDDFEDTPVGQKPKLADMSASFEAGASILVSDETAAGGKHSLKFTDAPGQENTWQPHMRYLPRISRGTVRLSFDVLLKMDAILAVEWRDWRSTPYVVGPSLRLGAGGQFTANGVVVTEVPTDQWIHVEVVCPVGQGAEPAYSLTVSVPGRDPVKIDKVPLQTERLRQLNWVGFISDADVATAIYVDNVRLAVE